MERIKLPQRDTRNLLYSLLTGFTPGSITFVNWELVTKRGNNALKDGERQNLFDRIADAHKEEQTLWLSLMKNILIIQVRRTIL